MYNWNTDITQLKKDPEQYAIWKLEQLINYGLDGEKIKQQVNFQKVTFENSFNRNLFFIHFTDEVIKTEFTYYPFEQVEQPQKKDGLKVDSLIDIAVNKLNTIFTMPRTRDFIDLYLI